MPALHWDHLYKGTAWFAKTRADYDKMISRQAQDGSVFSRREDQNNLAFMHNIRLAFSVDAWPALVGKLLAFVAVAEEPADIRGSEGAKLGSTHSRSDLAMTLPS